MESSDDPRRIGPDRRLTLPSTAASSMAVMADKRSRTLAKWTSWIVLGIFAFVAVMVVLIAIVSR